MNRGVKMESQRAKAIGRMIFQRYDVGKRGSLQPKQCYDLFSDLCYRMSNISAQPNSEEAQSMHEILDANRDKRVSQSDLQSLALRYLCNQNNINSRFQTRTTTTSTTITVSRQSKPQQRKITPVARKRLDVVRRLFKMFDKDNSGYLTQNQIPLMMQQTYKDINPNYRVSGDDVKSYMRMVDKDGDGRVTLNQFEEIVLISLEKAGIKIYQ